MSIKLSQLFPHDLAIRRTLGEPHVLDKSYSWTTLCINHQQILFGNILINIHNDLSKSRSTTAIVYGLRCCAIFSYRGRLINIRILISMSGSIYSSINLIHAGLDYPQFGSPQVPPRHAALSSKPRVMDIHGRGPEVLQDHLNLDQNPKFSG